MLAKTGLHSFLINLLGKRATVVLFSFKRSQVDCTKTALLSRQGILQTWQNKKGIEYSVSKLFVALPFDSSLRTFIWITAMKMNSICCAMCIKCKEVSQTASPWRALNIAACWVTWLHCSLDKNKELLESNVDMSMTWWTLIRNLPKASRQYKILLFFLTEREPRTT